MLMANIAMPAAALAIERPKVDPAALPPDGVPGPDQEMKQDNPCAAPLTVAVPDVVQQSPGNVMLAIPQAWKFSTGAGVTVGLVDTGVTPSPRFPALFAGGDYVLGQANGGLFDCDSHGTIVASIIAASPSDPAARPARSATPGSPSRFPVPDHTATTAAVAVNCDGHRAASTTTAAARRAAARRAAGRSCFRSRRRQPAACAPAAARQSRRRGRRRARCDADFSAAVLVGVRAGTPRPG
jgi:membrane-anchored mycosin MYCP